MSPALSLPRAWQVVTEITLSAGVRRWESAIARYSEDDNMSWLLAPIWQSVAGTLLFEGQFAFALVVAVIPSAGPDGDLFETVGAA